MLPRGQNRLLEVVGDGLAGLLLAKRMLAEGWDVRIRGDGQTNTPPVGLVHLFAGRSFRRSELELDCFAEAVAMWQNEPLARELTVRRSFTSGDRLDRSLLEAALPQDWTPRRLSEETVEYGPGFSIAAQALEARLRRELAQHLNPASLTQEPMVTVLALGARATELWPELRWDCSGGRTVEASSSEQQRVLIGHGLHLAPYPGRASVVLGGRFTPLGPAPEDELEKATALTGETHTFLAKWDGKRCAPADHRPVLGWVDATTFVFLGFGSRALFWLPYCLKLASKALEDTETEIHPELNWSRLF